MRKILGLASILTLALGLTFSACGGGDDTADSTGSDQDITMGDDSTVGLDTTIGTDTTTNDKDEYSDDDTVCVPDCDGKACGLDGCGGTCGSCAAGVPCVDFQCVCTANCDGKECGDDGCGGTCGTCAAGTCLDGTCCEPNCDGKECGSDGCGGVCGTCATGTCDDTGMCTEDTEMTCSDIFDCLNACPAGDQSCYQACITDAPTESQMAYSNLIDCLDTNGYWDCAETDEACMQASLDACETEYVTCFMVGQGTCKDLYLCLISCDSDTCAQACYSDASADAYLGWSDFLDCIDAQGYFDCAEGDTACMEAAWVACDEPFKACANGDLSCVGILECLNACAETDQMCMIDCQVSGTLAAQDAFEAIGSCIIEACGEEATVECQNQVLGAGGVCESLYNDCMAN